MLTKLHSTNFAGMELIRPLYLVREEDIISWGKYNNLHFLQCACRFTERTAAHEEESARREMKRLIAEMKKHNKNVDINIFRSMHNVNLATAVGYRLGDDDELHKNSNKEVARRSGSSSNAPGREVRQPRGARRRTGYW